MNKNRKLLIVVLICYIVLLTVLLLVIMPPAMQVIKEELFRYADVETVMIIVVGLVCCLTMLVLMLFYLSQKKTQEDSAEVIRISRMDDERNYLERQLNELNKKLVSTEDRLQEAYHLVLSTQNKQTDKSGKISTTAFLKGFGIDINNIEIQGDLAFILTPFHDDFNCTYEAVHKICQDMKLRPMRGDEEYIANDILKHIINQVVKSRLVIAILDGRNPNVFYELGIVHSLNKPTILLANVNTTVPFDLQNQYLVLYEDEADLREKLKNALLNILTLN